MNLLVSSLDNSIKIYKAPSKKTESFFDEAFFDFSLSSPAGQLNALSDFFNSEISKPVKDEQSIDLIIDDSAIGFGTFNLPRLSMFKVNDVINTRFKINFPNYKDYFMSHYELLKNENGSVYLYSICKRKLIDDYKDFFKGHNVSIHNITFFSDYYISFLNSKTDFPLATLIVGQNNSLLIISKNTVLLSVNTFDYGDKSLLSGEEYLHSPYFSNNVESKKYSCFVKEHFATKDVVTDDAVKKSDPNKALSTSLPKETRILKGNSLINYYIKNNIKKYCSMVLDVTSFYSSSPWFLPIGDINVICSDIFYEHLSEFEKSNENIKFNRLNYDMKTIMTKDVVNNKLFKSVVKGERRKIDWKKFFTMEIGKSKKKA